MNRTEMVRQVAGETGLGMAEADAAVRALLAAVAEALDRDGTVRLPGFGAFRAKARPARTGRDPRTGAEIALSASRSVSFRPGKALRDAVNRR